jgi:ESCRT-I complex subunit TSG101
MPPPPRPPRPQPNGYPSPPGSSRHSQFDLPVSRALPIYTSPPAVAQIPTRPLSLDHGTPPPQLSHAPNPTTHPDPRAQAPTPPRSLPPPNILDSDDASPQPPRPSSAATETVAAAAAAAPPPRPPNPELVHLRSLVSERLSALLASLQSSLAEDGAQLALIHSDLAKGEPALIDEMARLEAVRDVCASVRDKMSDVVKRAEGNVEVVRGRKEVEVDEIVCSTTVVYNQLLDLVAEDNALEDTIYQLGRGLNNDTARIDLDRFLKVRACLVSVVSYKLIILGVSNKSASVHSQESSFTSALSSTRFCSKWLWQGSSRGRQIVFTLDTFRPLPTIFGGVLTAYSFLFLCFILACPVEPGP